MLGTTLPSWSNLFIATAGASAALAGLVIVAISVNTAQILRFRQLPARAAATIASLLLILLGSVAGLIPDQSLRLLGAEILVFTALFWCIQMRATVLAVREHRAEDRPTREWMFIATVGQLQVIPFAVGGIVLALDDTNGLFWIVGGFLLVFAAAMMNAWVLLIEILR
jgi:modulator of FtsH protease